MERGGRAWGTGVQEAARARLQRFKARWGGRTREQIWNLHEGETILEYEGVSDGSRYKPAPGRRSGCRLGWSATGTATTSKGRTLQVEIRGTIRTFPGGGAEDSSTRPELQAVVSSGATGALPPLVRKYDYGWTTAPR